MLRGYVSEYVPCGNSGSADEKSPVNQRFPPIWGKNGCVFQFPQSGYEGIDLPQGIGFGERMIYNLAKGYFFAKEKEDDDMRRMQSSWVNIM